MKKRWMFAALVAIFALIMMGCPTDPDDTTDTGDPNDPNNPNGPGGGTPGVTSVTVEADDYGVKRGDKLQFYADVVVTGGAAKTVTWTMSGASKTTTVISDAGELSVAADEPVGTVITVTATSTVDTGKAGTAKATVVVVEQLFLDNGGYAIFKFTLPTGKKWEDYKGLSAEYKVNQDAYTRLQSWGVRGMRVMGPYTEEHMEAAEEDGNGIKAFNLNGSFSGMSNSFNGGINAPFIIDNYTPGYSDLVSLGMAPDAWFTVSSYNITGSRAHTGFTIDGGQPNLPAASDTGPFFFSLGITGQNATDSKQEYPVNRGIFQEIRNIRLISVSGEDDVIGETTDVFVAYNDPEVYCRRGGESASLEIPGVVCGCGTLDCECLNCTIDPVTKECQYGCCKLSAPAAEEDYTVDLTGLTVKNTVAAVGEYARVVFVPVTFEGEFTLASYTKITVRAKFFDLDNVEITAASAIDAWWGYGNLILVKGAWDPEDGMPDPFDLATDFVGIGQQYNLNQQTINWSLPSGAIAAADDFIGIIVTNGGGVEDEDIYNNEEDTDDPKNGTNVGGNGIGYVEVTEIIFHP